MYTSIGLDTDFRRAELHYRRDQLIAGGHRSVRTHRRWYQRLADSGARADY